MKVWVWNAAPGLMLCSLMPLDDGLSLEGEEHVGGPLLKEVGSLGGRPLKALPGSVFCHILSALCLEPFAAVSPTKPFYLSVVPVLYSRKATNTVAVAA